MRPVFSPMTTFPFTFMGPFTVAIASPSLAPGFFSTISLMIVVCCAWRASVTCSTAAAVNVNNARRSILPSLDRGIIGSGFQRIH